MTDDKKAVEPSQPEENDWEAVKLHIASVMLGFRSLPTATYEDACKVVDSMARPDGMLPFLRASRTPAPAAPDWQPIFTPPANGVLSLFCNMKASEMRRTFFVDWIVNGQFCGNRDAFATHWMPLPDYPAAIAASTQAEQGKEATP